MTNEQLKMAQDVSDRIRRLKNVIHLLKDVPKYKYVDIDNVLIASLVYDNRYKLLPIFENELKELNEKFSSL